LKRIPRARAFGVGGTIFDWRSAVVGAVSELAAIRGVDVDANQFATEWRVGMIAQLEAIGLGRAPFMNADAMHRRVLDEFDDRYPELGMRRADREALNLVWHRLKAWPGIPDDLHRLRQRFVIAPLSVLSVAIIVDSSRINGITWDAVLSCECLGHYKPDTTAYTKGCELLGLHPSEVMMVATDPGDLRSARDAGLLTAYVEPKADEPDIVRGSSKTKPGEFDLSVASLSELTEQLCPPSA
jgi:2-haloacid dehalogenase